MACIRKFLYNAGRSWLYITKSREPSLQVPRILHMFFRKSSGGFASYSSVAGLKPNAPPSFHSRASIDVATDGWLAACASRRRTVVWDQLGPNVQFYLASTIDHLVALE